MQQRDLFLLDENISERIAEGLKGFGFPVTHVLKVLKPEPGFDTVLDDQVFRACAKNHWFLITGDYRMQRNPAQRAAMAQAGIGVFILTGRGTLHLQDQRLLMVKRMPEIIELAESTPKPFVYGVPVRGAIKHLGPKRKA